MGYDFVLDPVRSRSADDVSRADGCPHSSRPEPDTLAHRVEGKGLTQQLQRAGKWPHIWRIVGEYANFRYSTSTPTTNYTTSFRPAAVSTWTSRRRHWRNTFGYQGLAARRIPAVTALVAGSGSQM
jgi:hypothetical protein